MRALVVEDDEAFRRVVAEILQREGYEVDLACSGEEVIRLAGLPRPVDVVVSDVRLGDGADGMDVLAAFQRLQPQVPVVLMTAFGDVESAMKAIQRGAYDYISKPFDNRDLLATVGRALERKRLIEENRALRQRPRDRMRDIVGRSPAMLEVYKTVARVAPTQATVLVVGESGTGKELVARAIHSHSPRASGPFVAVNCTALAESLLESELFGHVRGAFTGATTSKRGLFEEAQGGTLFLDEIGDVGPKMQAQLLRVLQEGEIRRVGGSEPIRVDVRVVASTNRDLEEEVERGRFREDLYFRVNVVSVRLPPLRDRPEDVPLLVDHFLAKYARREGQAEAGIAAEALSLLQRYSWPGNVRELENVVERALTLSKSGVILPADLPPEIRGAPPARVALTERSLIEDRPTLAELEQRYINLVLQQEGGNKKRAAEILGIDRRTLYRTLERTSGDRGGEDD